MFSMCMIFKAFLLLSIIKILNKYFSKGKLRVLQGFIKFNFNGASKINPCLLGLGGVFIDDKGIIL